MPGHDRRPEVTLHFAQSLDGRIATKAGRSEWLSGAESTKLAHQLRAEHDAVMVGVGTVIADDPRLTVRLVSGRSPIRVVVDSTLRIPASSKLLNDDGPPVIVATTDRAPANRMSALSADRCLVAPADPEEHVDLSSLMLALSERHIDTLLIEGGSALITSLLRLQLIDRLVVTVCPCLLGSGTDAVGELGIRNIAHAIRFSSGGFRSLGPDMVFEGRPTWDRKAS